MKRLDVLRHSMRPKPGSHLSQDGIELARYVGRTLGPYGRVVTSTLPRAIETAVALGFAVTNTVEALCAVDDGIVRTIRWPSDLSAIDRVLAKCPECTAFAQAQASLWEEIVAPLSDGEAGLIITHGAILELGTLALLRRSHQPVTGEAFGYCEGVRIYFGDHSGDRMEQLRVPAEMRMISN
jgi:hypothetical protein